MLNRFPGREKLLSRIGSAILGFLLFFAPAAQALPTGWEVVSGNVSFESQGTTLIITSSSNQAIINYQSFNIGAGETVNFIMPGDYASILNRILGGGPTSIEGALNSNGQVLLVNPAGINFAQTANVNVAGLLASSTLTNQQYLSNDLIPNPAMMVTNGGINNAGNLQATKFIILDGSSIVNEGTIALAGGIENGRIVATAQNDIVNIGNIDAHGGDIELSANNIIQSGTLISEGSSGNDGGFINIQAMGDTHLTGGSFTSARGRGVNSNSGDVMIMSQGNTYFDNGAILDVSGGDVSGDGGFSEVSAKNIVFFNGSAYGGATDGAAGQILIDPTIIRIRNAGDVDADGSVPHTDADNAFCAGGESCFQNTSFNGFANVTLEATDDIYVENAWSLGAVTAGNNLILRAGDDIFIQAALSTAGGNITLAANYDLSGAPVPSGNGDITTTGAGSITTGGGSLTMTGRNFDLSGNIITGAGATNLTATGDITLQSGAAMNSAGGLTTNANNNVTINNDFNTTGALTFTADADNAGGGTLALGATTDILTSGAAGPGFSGSTINFVNGSTVVDSGAGNTTVTIKNGGTMAIDNTISNTGGTVTLTTNATGDTNITLGTTANLNTLSTLNVTARNNLTINNDFNTTGTLSFTADSDNASGGTLALGATTDILTTGATGPTFNGTTINFVAGSTIVDTGAGNTTVNVKNGGTLTVDNTISNTGGTITLDGTTAGSNNVVLGATANLNTVGVLNVSTRNDITINNDFNTTGTLSFTSDSDNASGGTLALGATTDILTTGATGPTFNGTTINFVAGSTIVDTGAGNTTVNIKNGGTLTVDNTISNTGGTITLDGTTGGNNNITLGATANLNTVGTLNVSTRNDITINNDFNTTGTLSFTSDSDNASGGTLALGATTDILTTGATGPTFNGTTINFVAGSTIVDTGAGNTTVNVKNGGTLTVDNTISNTGGTITLDGTTGGNNNVVLGATANLNTVGVLNVSTRNDITINNDFNTTGTLSFTSDSDNASGGTLTLGATTDILTTGASGPTFTGTNLSFVNGSTIVDTGAGNTTVNVKNGGTLTVDNTISNTGGTITLDGTTAGNNNITLGANANLNTVGTLNVSARNNITLNNDFNTSGTLTFNADSDNTTGGAFTLNSGADMITTGATAPSIIGAGVNLAAGSLINPNGAALTVATKNGGNMSISGTVTSTGDVIFNSVNELDVNTSADIYTVNTLKVNANTGIRLYTPITLTPGNTADYDFAPGASAAKYDFNPNADLGSGGFMLFGDFALAGLDYTMNYPTMDLWFYGGTLSTGANTLTANAENIEVREDMSTSTLILNANNSIAFDAIANINNITKLTANANNGIDIRVPINLTAASSPNFNFETPNTGVQWDFNPDVDGNGGYLYFGNNITLNGVDLTLNLPTATTRFLGGIIDTGANTLTVNSLDILVYDNLTTSKVILNASRDIYFDAAANIQNVTTLTSNANDDLQINAALTLTPANVANYTFTPDADSSGAGDLLMGGAFTLSGLDYALNYPNLRVYFLNGGSVSTGANTLTVNANYINVNSNFTTSKSILNAADDIELGVNANLNNITSMAANANDQVNVFSDITISAANSGSFNFNPDADTNGGGDFHLGSNGSIILSGVNYTLSTSAGRNVYLDPGSTINTGAANTLTVATAGGGDVFVNNTLGTSRVIINSDDVITFGVLASMDSVRLLTANAKGNIDFNSGIFAFGAGSGPYVFNADSDLNGVGDFNLNTGSYMLLYLTAGNSSIHGYNVNLQTGSALYLDAPFAITADNTFLNNGGIGYFFNPSPLTILANNFDNNAAIAVSTLTIAPTTAGRTINLIGGGVVGDAESGTALDINQGEINLMEATGFNFNFGNATTTGTINVNGNNQAFGVDFNAKNANVTLTTTGAVVADAVSANPNIRLINNASNRALTITGGAGVGAASVGSALAPLRTTVNAISLRTAAAGDAWVRESDALLVNLGVISGNLDLQTTGAGNITLSNMDVFGTSNIETFAAGNSDITGTVSNIFRGNANFDSNDDTTGDISITADFRANVSAWGDSVSLTDNAGNMAINGVVTRTTFTAATTGAGRSITLANVDAGTATTVSTAANTDSDISGNTGLIFRGTSSFNTNDNAGGDITLTGDFQGGVTLSGDLITVTDTAADINVTSFTNGTSATFSQINTAANGNATVAINDLQIAGAGFLRITADQNITVSGIDTNGTPPIWATTLDTLVANSTSGGNISLTDFQLTGAAGVTGRTAPQVGPSAGIWLGTNGGNISVTNATLDGTMDIVTAGGGDVTLNNTTIGGSNLITTGGANGNITLTTVATTGATTIQSTGTVTGTGNTFTGATSIDANLGTAYNINLTTSNWVNATNSFDGNNITATDSSGNFTASSVTAAGTADLRTLGAAGNLTVQNATVAGDTTMVATQNLTATANNNFANITATANGTAAITEASTVDIVSLTNPNATGPTTITSTGGNVNIANAAVNSPTTINSAGTITATNNNNFGTLTATGNGTIAITEQSSVAINSITQNHATATTTLQSANANVSGKDTAVADVISAGTGDVTITAGDAAGDATSRISGVNVSTGGNLTARAFGKDAASNDSISMRGSVAGNILAENGTAGTNTTGDIILGDAIANMNTTGTTNFKAAGEVRGKGTMGGVVSGTGLRVSLEKTGAGNLQVDGITATGNSGVANSLTAGPFTGGSAAVVNLMAFDGSIVGVAGGAVDDITAANGNVVLQAGNAAADTTSVIDVSKVNIGGNLRMLAAGDSVGNNSGTSINVGSGYVGGYILATGEAFTFTDGGINIALDFGNMRPTRIQADGNINLSAQGSIIQDATLASNGKSIFTYGDTTLSALGFNTSYVDVGIRGYNTTSDLSILASGSSNAASTGVSADLNGYMGGNVIIRNDVAGATMGRVNLGNTIGASVGNLNDTNQIFDVNQSLDILANGDVNMYGGYNLAGTGNINITSAGTITARIDLGYFNLGPTGQITSTKVGGTGIDILNYRQGIIATGANAIQAANSNVILQTGNGVIGAAAQWIDANINIGAAQTLTLTAYGKNGVTGHAINVTGSGPAVPAVTIFGTGTCSYLGSPC